MRVLLDGRPLQGGSSVRGIGSYTRGLLSGFATLDAPPEVTLLVARGASLPPEVREFGLRASAQRLRTLHPTLQPVADPVLVARALRRERPDLYHGVEFGQPLVAGMPVVITVHDLIPFIYPAWYPWVRRARIAALRLLRRADRIIAVSESTARDTRRLARVSAARIRVVAEGVSPVFRPASPAEVTRALAAHGITRPYLLAVGTFDPRKRIAALAQIVRTIRREHDVQLVIAGEQASFLPHVQRTLAAAGIEEATRITGHLGLTDLVALYSGAECLLFTSAYEGFGLPPLEAMACGTPVVAFANSSLPEVGGDTAYLVADGDATAMAGVAGRLLSDPAERVRAVERGHAWVANFTWQRAAERTLDVYNEMLADRSG